MALNELSFQIKGIQKDISVFKSSNEYANDALNIRLNAREDGTSYSITNEKGNREIPLYLKVYDNNKEYVKLNSIDGVILGNYLFDDNLILFIKQTNFDKILRLNYNEDNDCFYIEELYSGNLNFNVEYPIECIGYYENEKYKKVYWVDGLNQTRFINILADYDKERKYWNNQSFDFMQEMLLQEEVTITKNYNGFGEFPAGSIKYAFVYYNKYGQESKPFYISPQQFITFLHRACSPEETVKMQFDITINNLDPKFEYVKVYSILRSSYNGLAIVKIVKDIRINKEEITQVINSSDIKIPSYLASSIIIENKNTDEIINIGEEINKEAIVIDNIVDSVDENKSITIESNKDNVDVITIKINGDYNNYNIIRKTGSISFSDNNTGILSSVSELQNSGSSNFIASTIEQKDNLMFLGNIKENKYVEFDKIKKKILEDFKNNENNENNEKNYIQFNNEYFKDVEDDEHIIHRYNDVKHYKKYINANELYPYSFDIDTKTFKCELLYYIALLLLDKYGDWSEPIYLKNIKNGFRPLIKHPYINGTTNNEIDETITNIYLPYFQAVIPGVLTENNFLINSGYKKIRYLMAIPNFRDRKILALGIINPTVYDIKTRCSIGPQHLASWYFRPVNGRIAWKHNLRVLGGESYNSEFQYLNNIQYAINAINGDNEIITADIVTIRYIKHKFEETQINSNQYTYKLEVEYYNGTNDDLYKIKDTEKSFTIDAIVTFENYSSSETDYGVRVYSSVTTMDEKHIKVLIDDLKKAGKTYTESYFTYDLNDDFAGETLVAVKEKYVLKNDFTEVVSYNLDSGNAPTISNLIGNIQSNQCFVDLSVIEFHSPDITDINYSSIDNLNGFELNIIGITPINNVISDYSVNTNPAFDGSGIQLYNFSTINIEWFNDNNITNKKLWGLYTAPIFKDTVTYEDSDKDNNKDETVKAYYENTKVLYAVYPWHRDGSLNNEGKTYKNIDARSAYPINKVFCNEWVSYLNVIFKDTTNNKINEFYSPRIYKEQDGKMITLYSKDKDVIKTEIYNGNVDMVFYNEDKYNIDIYENIYGDIGTFVNNKNSDYQHFKTLNDFVINNKNKKIDYTLVNREVDDLINIRYLSNSHVVVKFNKTLNGEQIILPHVKDTFTVELPNSLSDKKWSTPESSNDFYTVSELKKYINRWDDANSNANVASKQLSLSASEIEKINSDKKPYLYLAELVNPVNKELTENDLLNEIFIPITDAVSIFSDFTELKLNDDYIIGKYGDTFFGRWDCLKTMPYTNSDEKNSVVEILSFMVESYINLDGRYDNYRNNTKISTISTANFNKYNDVYNQLDNFENFNITDDTLLNNVYPNRVVWSLVKEQQGDVDTWSKITTNASVDLDGQKGKINSIINYQNNLYVFLDKGISNLLYNPQALITATDGTPIELANSGRVEGYRYLTDNIGCQNKYSIKNTEDGVFFIDNINKGIYLLSVGLAPSVNSLSETLGFSSWINDLVYKELRTVNNDNFITFNDIKHKDIYFVTKDYCLGFNSTLKSFVSFYSYENTDIMININDNLYAINNGKIYKLFDGDYCNIYGKQKPYNITLVCNEYPTVFKTFTNIDYRLECYDNNEKLLLNDKTFNTVRAWHRFQDTDYKTLNSQKGKTSILQRKLRSWRITIPRDKDNKLDRISNMWAKILLSCNEPYKFETSDISVKYLV